MEFTWSVDWDDPKLQVKILRIDGDGRCLGFMTLDFKWRCWDLGSNTGGLRRVSTIRELNGDKIYKGTNWKKHMEEDAKAHLLKTVKEIYRCT